MRGLLGLPPKIKRGDTLVGEFSANYGRTGYLAIGKGKCGMCGKRRVTLAADSSEGEYGEVRICLPCIQGIFSEHAEPVKAAPEHPNPMHEPDA